jgi:arylsulfatase A-like enzyme
MDWLLADFFHFLDREVGLRHCLFVFTSDHGVSPIPAYISSQSGRRVYGVVDRNALRASAESTLTQRFRSSTGGVWIDRISGGNVFFRQSTLQAAGVDAEEAALVLCDAASRRPEIAAAFTRGQIRLLAPTTPLERRIRNNFNDQRSGDAIILTKPLWGGGDAEAGASHGEPYESDAHVPILFRGEGILPGIYYNEASPVDIAPTLSALTGIEHVPAQEGRVLSEALAAPGAKKNGAAGVNR